VVTIAWGEITTNLPHDLQYILCLLFQAISTKCFIASNKL